MVKTVLQQLMNRPEPLVKEVAPAPGSRAERFVQLLSPELHSLEVSERRVESAEAPVVGASATLGQRVAQLEGEVAMLRGALVKLAAAIGASNPLGDSNEQTE
jgi:uncharacterized protein YceH (UPF0502 family)